MKLSKDLSAADWLTKSDASPERLIIFGPATFPAYARLRYLPDPTRPGMNEADAIASGDHPLIRDATRTALMALARYSESTNLCHVCVWEGDSSMSSSPQLPHGPLVELPHRRYVLFTVNLKEALEDGNDLFDHPTRNSPPAFVWPDDHRWCFVSDVDPHWAGIGADRGTIDQLVADPNLDVVHAAPGEKQPTYY